MPSDPFTSHHFLDKRTGKIVRKYSYKRKPCNRLVLTSKMASQLSGYSLIEKDLRSCLVWLDEIERRHDEGPASPDEHFSHGKNRENYNLIKGLFVATLTFYAKGFTRCEGRRIKLERSQIDAKFLDAHDDCMSYRHNFAAHSGAEKLETVSIVAAYPNLKKGTTVIKLYRELNQPDLYWPQEGGIGLRDLIEHVRSQVDAKITQLAEKIQNEEAPRIVMQKLTKSKG